MRIIEPHMFENKAKRRNQKLSRWLIVVGLFILIAVPVALIANPADAPSSDESQVSQQAATSNGVAGTRTASNTLKTFNSSQFQSLYESLAMPNTELITVAPAITGNVDADQHIRKLAEARGYGLRSVPVLPIIKTNTAGLDEDDLLQPKAYEAWLLLEKQAKKDGIPLKLNSGYRSIEWQRRYFNQQMQARGVNVARITSDRFDSVLTSVMSVVAPPGYSRHHTGYTIDLVCQDGSGRAFEFTPCFAWLSKDNYKVAKNSGWIPSYPEGAKKQGPEPEPWEYVWVGTDATHE